MRKYCLLLLVFGLVLSVSAETKTLEILPKKETGTLKAKLVPMVAKLKLGTNEFFLKIFDDEGKPFDQAKVRVLIVANMPSMMHGDSIGDGTYVEPGVWTFKAKFSMGGEWAIKVLVKDGESELGSFEFIVSLY